MALWLTILDARLLTSNKQLVDLLGMRARIMRSSYCEDTAKRTRLSTDVDSVSRGLLQLPLATRENARNAPSWYHTRLQQLLNHVGNLLR